MLIGWHVIELSLTVPITNSLAFLFTVLGEWWAEGKVISGGSSRHYMGVYLPCFDSMADWRCQIPGLEWDSSWEASHFVYIRRLREAFCVLIDKHIVMRLCTRINEI